MKILHTVEFYHPSIGGAQEVVRHLSERMVAAGHDVYVATTKLPNRKTMTINGVKVIEFAISGNQVNGLKGEVKKYKDYLLNEKFDVVMNYAAQQWATDIFLSVIDKVKAKKVFVPCGFSALYDPAYSDYFAKMPDYLRQYDELVFLADDYRDINFARDHGLKNFRVVPNAADEREFATLPTEDDKRFTRARHGLGGLVITTLGNHTNEKGHRELIKCFKAMPFTPATLVILGSPKRHDGCFDTCEASADSCNNGRKFLGKRIMLIDGSNRKDVVDILKASDMFAFFSNIECSPLVLFEAAAAGVPFIASTAGNNAEIAAWTKAGVIVPSKPLENGRVKVDMKQALKTLTMMAYQKKRRHRLGTAGHKTVLKNYTWNKITKDYLALYTSLVKKGNE